MQPMGDESNTAQVHPQKLSQALMEAAQQKGAQLRIGEVQNITTSGKRVTGMHAVAAIITCWRAILYGGGMVSHHYLSVQQC